MIEIIYFVIFAAYSIVLLILMFKWVGIRDENISAEAKDLKHKVSIVVPVRNEEENIIELLNSFEKQNCDIANFEVIVVNDHSEDETLSFVENYQPSYQLQIHNLDNDQGKKSAIEYGVSLAKHDYILQTDGDCVVPPNWVSSYILKFESGDRFVFGSINKTGSSVYQWLDSFEQFVLILIGAVSFKFGSPTMCNGANMGYSKSDFDKLGGFGSNKQISSGDDEFLLKSFYKFNPKRVSFLKTREAIVSTRAHDKLVLLMGQRIRWISKWKYNRSISSLLQPLLLFVFYVVYLTVCIRQTIQGNLENVLIIGGLKLCVDSLFLYPVLKFYKRSELIFTSILIQVVYPLYVIFMGVLSFKSSYKWKGRTMK